VNTYQQLHQLVDELDDEKTRRELLSTIDQLDEETARAALWHLQRIHRGTWTRLSRRWLLRRCGSGVGQLLGEVPHDRRVQEGLLLAARGTGDCAQLSQVWQQMRACVDGDTDIELRSMYERLMSETRVASAVGGR